MVSLKVDGLTHRTCLEDLESLFEKYGKVGDVYIPKVNLIICFQISNAPYASNIYCTVINVKLD